VNEIQTSIEEGASDAERQLVVQGLVDYNNAQTAPEASCDLTVLSRHDGEVVGGLLGYTWGNWLFVRQLWVADAFRGRGLGRTLMRVAEHEAHSRGCLYAHLDTFDFQALPFYQKLGYRIFGQLDDYPVGHTRYFLQKRNLHETGNA
jgi:GNAT superfamily N-acetyltransferase